MNDPFGPILEALEMPAVSLDRDGRILGLNRALLAATGRTREALIGQDWADALAPMGQRDEVSRLLADLLGGGGPRRLEHAIDGADGRRWLSWRASTWEGRPGHSGNTLLIGEDVTERRRTEMALADSEARYRGVVELAIDAIVTTDSSGTIESFNRAAEQTFGYSADEAIGRNVAMLMPSPYCEEHDGYIERYLRSGVPHVIGRGREVLGRRKNGTIFPLELSLSDVALGDRRLFTGIVRDISERRRTELLASVGTLASALAHEIGTPLGVILGRAEQVRALLPAGEAARGLDIIVAQVERVTKLMGRLLSITRRDDPVSRPTDVNQAVRAAIEVVHDRIGRRHLTLVEELDPGLPRAQGDLDRLSQVVLNLLLNAIDATAAGGTLTVRTARIPGASGREGIELTVADTGSGIPSEHVDRIFDPFFTTKPPGQGTGLGLAVVHGIVRDFGGSVEVLTKVGQGTTFHVHLPLAAPQRAVD